MSGGNIRDSGTVRAVPLEEWDPLVRRLNGDTTFHSADYHRASAQLEPSGTIPVLLHHRGYRSETVLPLLLRPLPHAAGWDATSIYGYAGPLTAAPAADAGREFGAAVDAWAIRNQVVASFIRYHPLLENHRIGPAQASPSHVGHTVVWQLARDGDPRSRMHSHHRRAARRADRAGLEIRISSHPTSLDHFRALHQLTMHRLKAAAFYDFTDGYWNALANSSSTILVEGLLNEQTVAAVLCLTSPPFLHYHLGASTEPGRSIGASHRVLVAAAEWATRAGLQAFDLGGAPGGSDSPLFRFKQRFDPEAQQTPLYVGRWVHDTTRYADLAARSTPSGYFPPWRQWGLHGRQAGRR